MMTKQERRQLREIERELQVSDPRLDLLMSGGTYPRPFPSRLVLVLVDLLAAAMIVVAVVTGLLVLILLSSLTTVLAMSMHVVRKRVRSV
jgi:hypothetical protein